MVDVRGSGILYSLGRSAWRLLFVHISHPFSRSIFSTYLVWQW